MNFCGSIVSNDFPTFEGTPNNTVQIYNDVLKKQMKRRYGSQYGTPAAKAMNLTFNLTCEWQNTTCYELTF